MALDQLGVVDEELLDAAGEQVDIVKSLVRKHLTNLRSMPLIIRSNNYDLVLKILKSAQGLKVIISVYPAMRKAHRAHNMKFIKFLVAVHTLAPDIDYDNVLVREIEKFL